jgi:eukaryotic-like serine/threonine-protein kinase
MSDVPSIVPKRFTSYADHIPVNGFGQSTPKRPRCKIAMVGGSGLYPSTELHNLLRSRLQIASLITFGTFLVFLIRNLFDERDPMLVSPLSMGLHAGVTALSGFLAAILWSRRPLCMPSLRSIEIVLFGAPILLFAWMQFCGLCSAQILDIAKEASEGRVVRIGALAGAIRWFCLTVIYGMFIPNTWKRCAVMVAFFTLPPIIINIAMGLYNPRLTPYLDQLVIDTCILMTIAAVIAIFGSYKISSLREQAEEARKLGQYTLKEKLGSGGMGEVYLAEHLLLRRPCAIKLIRPEQASDPAFLTRFEREVRAMATLTHWNSVEVFDYGHSEDGTFYYVMEYLPGLSLQELVEKHGPVCPGRAVHLLRQVCQALREAHGIGLIHRDIKPSNILICQRGAVSDVAKLLDFGLVHSITLDAGTDEKLTVLGTIVGSPPFMSPEQANGTDKVDRRSDIYSLGAVAYFLLTGQAPFVRDTAMKMLMAHAYEPVRPLSDVRASIPLDLERVILRCLEKEPEKRFQDAASLEKALSECLCANDWTEEEATQWWRKRDSDKDGVVDRNQTLVYAGAAT